MPRRSNKAETALLAAALIIGVPIYVAGKFVEAVGWIPLVVGAAIAAAAYFGIKQHSKQKRLAYLRGKYADEDVVRKIFEGYFWSGQSQEQLRDSLGSPVEIDNKLLKTKTREVWKYQRQGSNRFGLRITVENGFVTGWDQKG